MKTETSKHISVIIFLINKAS